jgi:hypothetical protein
MIQISVKRVVVTHHAILLELILVGIYDRTSEFTFCKVPFYDEFNYENLLLNHTNHCKSSSGEALGKNNLSKQNLPSQLIVQKTHHNTGKVMQRSQLKHLLIYNAVTFPSHLTFLYHNMDYNLTVHKECNPDEVTVACYKFSGDYIQPTCH